MAISLDRLEALRSQTAALRGLVAYLAAQGYTAEGVARLANVASPVELFTMPAMCSMLARDELEARREPLAALARLFWLAQPIDRAVFADLPPEVREASSRLGLVSTDGERVRGEVAVQEWGGAWFLADRLFEYDGEHLEQNRAADLTMPIHESTLLLHRALAGDAALRSALDLGAGCGVQSIRRSGRYDVVHGIDLSARCVAFAAVNASINDARGEYQVGDCFTFDGGRRYDHVIFNTPWAVDYHAGAALPSEQWARFVEERLGRLLSAEGVAQLFVALPVPADAPTVEDALRRWPALLAYRVSALTCGGALRISPEELARRSVRRDCLHLRQPSDGPRLAQYLLDHRVREVIPLVLTLAVADSGARTVEVRADERPLTIAP